MHVDGEGLGQCQWGSGALLMRLTAKGKDQFSLHEVLVLMDQRGGGQTVCVRGERDRLQSVCLSVLEAFRSWRNGRLQPITFSAERIVRCSLLSSSAEAAEYQVRMDQWWRCRSAPSLSLTG